MAGCRELFADLQIFGDEGFDLGTDYSRAGQPMEHVSDAEFLQIGRRSLAESAKIDGANDIYIFFKIVLPISMPAIATVGLFYAMGFWNKWFEAMLFISDENKFPLQYLIMRIMNNADFANQLSAKISLAELCSFRR